jgi:hypothetical protein
MASGGRAPGAGGSRAGTGGTSGVGFVRCASSIRLPTQCDLSREVGCTWFDFQNNLGPSAECVPNGKTFSDAALPAPNCQGTLACDEDADCPPSQVCTHAGFGTNSAYCDYPAVDSGAGDARDATIPLDFCEALAGCAPVRTERLISRGTEGARVCGREEHACLAVLYFKMGSASRYRCDVPPGTPCTSMNELALDTSVCTALPLCADVADSSARCPADLLACD